MAKRSIRPTDPENTTTPERRRRTTPENGQATAPKAPRARRKTDSPGKIGAQAPEAPAAITAAAAFEPSIASETGDAPLASVAQVAHVEVPHELIAERAYHIYLARGAQPGDQFADWVSAERQLREQLVSSGQQNS